ncbi:hypothetical protein [Paucibacter sp. B51]|uniref:hypothetical protein n=1 Tax=Paucibacter sp. B51 TaxID=2993315 RepID=UPI0022EC079C|nr:hypothetical protein [Paucibacter sp. B51]
MANTYSAYIPATGEITGKRITTASQELLSINSAPGEAWLQGEVDHLGHRVEMRPDDFGNAVVPVVVQYQPPAPADSDWVAWSWSEPLRRWVPVPTLAALKLQASEPLLAALASLDARVIRPSSEIAVAQALGQAVPEAATLRLSGLLAEKEALRHLLRQIQAATTKEELDALPRYEGPHDESAL